MGDRDDYPHNCSIKPGAYGKGAGDEDSCVLVVPEEDVFWSGAGVCCTSSTCTWSTYMYSESETDTETWRSRHTHAQT